MLFMDEVDILDGIPLPDIKPYVPVLNIRFVDRTVWLSVKPSALPGARS
jgi:tRNA (Thr-GGU) A37 N-methylase